MKKGAIPPIRESKLTKALTRLYLLAGGAGYFLLLWFLLYLVVPFFAGSTFSARLPAAPLMPWLPIFAVAMLASKYAAIWSYRRDLLVEVTGSN